MVEEADMEDVAVTEMDMKTIISKEEYYAVEEVVEDMEEMEGI